MLFTADFYLEGFNLLAACREKKKSRVVAAVELSPAQAVSTARFVELSTCLKSLVFRQWAGREPLNSYVQRILASQSRTGQLFFFRQQLAHSLAVFSSTS